MLDERGRAEITSALNRRQQSVVAKFFTGLTQSFGHAIAEQNDAIAGLQLYGLLSVRRVLEQSHDRTARLQPLDALASEHKRRIVPGVAIVEASVRLENAENE